MKNASLISIGLRLGLLIVSIPGGGFSEIDLSTLNTGRNLTGWSTNVTVRKLSGDSSFACGVLWSNRARGQNFLAVRCLGGDLANSSCPSETSGTIMDIFQP